ncbi:polysaccharide pyruvyl transferase family protein [Labilibaculum euxinus]|uniref:Polysaccharide pyruvyl transferase family protein n=1 Tax=Labilibaculum euxinus TaxID=2686357 RepID=A0A7M4DAF7_9BACT|nr:polysaccharide pyruvyl transferase family protein [Labilibaculum euxinus]MUP39636.1 polysaccharide pyruvyl transferase family protein [Labilibaculum euxinus]MVB08841.1 polysaccharide pyruvyl transferase family protein [Labilibaculum euxinus]
MEEIKKDIRVGVLTLPYDANYGWILQHYALLNSLNECGYNPISIQRKWNKQDNRSMIYHIKKWVYYNILTKNIYSFYKNNITPKTEIYDTQESIKGLSKYKLDAVVVGSDQVWRTEFTSGVGDNYFLDFIDSKHTSKIAYAASFGIDEWKEGVEKTEKIKSLLEDFTYISVRENTGIDLCKNHFNLEVESVIDPTLLLDKDQYNKLLVGTTECFKKPTLVTYILDYNKDKSDVVKQVSNKLNLKVFDLYPKKKRICNYYKSVKTWLRAYRDSDFVVTDSFHGTVFSIIYNKPFITIANKERGLTRFTSLLNIVGLSSRLIFTLEDILDNNLITEEIDYSKVNSIVKKQQEKSLSLFHKYIKSK